MSHGGKSAWACPALAAVRQNIKKIVLLKTEANCQRLAHLRAHDKSVHRERRTMQSARNLSAREAVAPRSASLARRSRASATGRAHASVKAIAEPPAKDSKRPKPQVPDGTPMVEPLDLPMRPRRNRRSPTIRAAFREVRRDSALRSVRVTRSTIEGVPRYLSDIIVLTSTADAPQPEQLPAPSVRARWRRGHSHLRHAGLQPSRLVRGQKELPVREPRPLGAATAPLGPDAHLVRSGIGGQRAGRTVGRVELNVEIRQTRQPAVPERRSRCRAGRLSQAICVREICSRIVRTQEDWPDPRGPRGSRRRREQRCHLPEDARGSQDPVRQRGVQPERPRPALNLSAEGHLPGSRGEMANRLARVSHRLAAPQCHGVARLATASSLQLSSNQLSVVCVQVYTDVALDPYSTMGHDGIVRSDGGCLRAATARASPSVLRMRLPLPLSLCGCAQPAS